MAMGAPASARAPRSGPSSARGGPPGGGGEMALIDAFGQFYAEVVLLKRAVTSSILPASLKSVGELTPDVIRQRLVDIFHNQSTSIGKNFADHELRILEEAQYLMVAMADEVFLQLSWAGRQEWAQKPLEAHVFRTHDAGERFFNRLDDIFEHRATASTELLTVYLTALALGFQGKFAALNKKSECEVYRKRLAAYIHRLDPIAMAPERELCPQAGANTKTSAIRVTLPSLMKGFYALILVFVGWIVIAQIFWYYRTREVSEKLDDVEAADVLGELKKLERELDKEEEPK